MKDTNAQMYNNFKYTILDDDTVCIEHYKGSARAIIVPAKVAGRRVTRIGEGAFVDEFSANYTAISIPNSVTHIEDLAFADCTALTRLTLPTAVKEIGEGAFAGCTSLRELVLPVGLRRIGDDAFCGCTSLTEITLPARLKVIGASAFGACTSLTLKVDPDNKNFRIASGLLIETETATLVCCPASTDRTHITVPEGVVRIGGGAFSGCAKVERIDLPESVTELGERAFFNCRALRGIELPPRVTAVPADAFGVCESLESVDLPEGLRTIGDYAFTLCRKLQKIDLPDGVVRIGDCAFAGCDALGVFTIPAGLFEMGDDPFCLSEHIELSVAPDHEHFELLEGVLFDRETSALVYCPPSMRDEYRVPDGTERIGDYAFSGCRELKLLFIPESVAIVDDRAFYYCPAAVTAPLRSFASKFRREYDERERTDMPYARFDISRGVPDLADYPFVEKPVPVANDDHDREPVNRPGAVDIYRREDPMLNVSDLLRSVADMIRPGEAVREKLAVIADHLKEFVGLIDDEDLANMEWDEEDEAYFNELFGEDEPLFTRFRREPAPKKPAPKKKKRVEAEDEPPRPKKKHIEAEDAPKPKKKKHIDSEDAPC